MRPSPSPAGGGQESAAGATLGLPAARAPSQGCLQEARMPGGFWGPSFSPRNGERFDKVSGSVLQLSVTTNLWEF